MTLVLLAGFVVLLLINVPVSFALAIASFLVAHGINIEDWLVEMEASGSVIYLAQVTVPESADFRQIQGAFQREMAGRGLNALLCHENIFRATNEIGPIRALIGTEARHTRNLEPATCNPQP